MRIEELLDKKQAREIKIIKKLILAGGKITDTEMLEYLHISKAAFESDLEEIHMYLKPFEKECRLFYDGQDLSIELAAHFSIAKILTVYVEDSIQFQLIHHLYQYKEFTIAQLTTKFMISESSLFRKIKELNQLLKEFGLVIRNGRLRGSELQIRYFYFQIYWFLTPYDQHKYKTLTVQNSQVIEAVEKHFSLSFTEHNKMKMSLWITISKKRLTEANREYFDLSEKMNIYLNDPLLMEMRIFILRFFNRYALEVDEEESMLHYIFLLSMSVLSESDFTEYQLIRGRRTPTSLADTFILERVLLYYRPQKVSPELEKTIQYYFSQIHSKLYFFKGELEMFDRDNIWQKEEQLSSNKLSKFSEELLQQSLELFDREYQEEDSLFALSLVKYLSILAIIEFKLIGEICIGIDLKMDQLYSEVMTHVLILSLKNIHGITIEAYDKQKEYELILTNDTDIKQYARKAEVYVLSELGSTYDIEQIKKIIKGLHQQPKT